MKYLYYDQEKLALEDAEAQLHEELSAKSPKKFTVDLEKIRRECYLAEMRCTISQARVEKYTAMCKLAKKFAQEMAWNLELTQSAWRGYIFLTMPICYFEQDDEASIFFLLLKHADNMLIHASNPPGIRIALGFSFCDETQ